MNKVAMMMVGMMGVSVMANTAAHADGFECEATAADLAVKVYNHVNAEEGTRNAAIMILSNPAVKKGNKTIAVFQDANGVLENEGVQYTANVDLRFRDSKRKGELVGGTKLGFLDTISLNVGFAYGQDVEDGDFLPGTITLVKRDGKVIHLDAECTRYLKN